MVMMNNQKKQQLEDLPAEDVDMDVNENGNEIQDEKLANNDQLVEDAAQIEKADETRSKEEDPLVILQNQLDTVIAERDEFKDALQRERADFSNFRKRIQREQQELRSMIVAETVQKFLPVLDDFERAMQNLPDNVTDSDWFQGFQLIEKKFDDVLASYGIEKLDPLGEPFDHNFHDAISTADSDEYESGTVMDVLQKGYVMGGKCIRPAIVRVAD
jgi:molecular chaperone GrpE